MSLAGGLKPPALGCEACLRRLVEAAQAAFVPFVPFVVKNLPRISADGY